MRQKSINPFSMFGYEYFYQFFFLSFFLPSFPPPPLTFFFTQSIELRPMGVSTKRNSVKGVNPRDGSITERMFHIIPSDQQVRTRRGTKEKKLALF